LGKVAAAGPGSEDHITVQKLLSLVVFLQGTMLKLQESHNNLFAERELSKRWPDLSFDWPRDQPRQAPHCARLTTWHPGNGRAKKRKWDFSPAGATTSNLKARPSYQERMFRRTQPSPHCIQSPTVPLLQQQQQAQEKRHLLQLWRAPLHRQVPQEGVAIAGAQSSVSLD